MLQQCSAIMHDHLNQYTNTTFHSLGSRLLLSTNQLLSVAKLLKHDKPVSLDTTPSKCMLLPPQVNWFGLVTTRPLASA